MTKALIRRDISIIVGALESEPTVDHSLITLLLESYGVGPTAPGANRRTRLTHLVKSLFESDNGETELRSLLNEVYWEDSQSEFRRNRPAARKLLDRLATLYDLDDDGIPNSTPESELGKWNPKTYRAPKTSIAVSSTSANREAPTVTQPISGGDVASNRVFVVHGRDSKAHAELERFLEFVGCRVLTWNDVKASCPSPQPTTLEIVKAGIAKSKAIVVLFTPDDIGHVKPEFAESTDLTYETQPTGQARQNVIFEAGMALGVAPEKTLLVRYGITRPMSDIDGHNWTRLSNEFDDRKLFFDELKKTGLDVNERRNLADTSYGDFPPRG